MALETREVIGKVISAQEGLEKDIWSPGVGRGRVANIFDLIIFDLTVLPLDPMRLKMVPHIGSSRQEPGSDASLRRSFLAEGLHR